MKESAEKMSSSARNAVILSSVVALCVVLSCSVIFLVIKNDFLIGLGHSPALQQTQIQPSNKSNIVKRDAQAYVTNPNEETVYISGKYRQDCFISAYRNICLQEHDDWYTANILRKEVAVDSNECVSICLGSPNCRSASYISTSGVCELFKTCLQPHHSNEQCVRTVFSLGCDNEEIIPILYKGCKDIKNHGSTESGVYDIEIPDTTTVKVWCDMEDKDGWLVIQRRYDGSEDFYRGWDEYRTGFGDPRQEFWIGLDNLHSLTDGGHPTRLRVEVTTHNGEFKTATYNNFSISNEMEKYRLTVSGHSGNLSDCLESYHNGNAFSTRDNDNDQDSLNCAEVYKDGWWYNKCHDDNNNDIYHKDETMISNTENASWENWKENSYKYKTVTMKIDTNPSASTDTAIYPGCEDLKVHGSDVSGLYNIKLVHSTTLKVWCDMEDEDGWLVIQRRYDGRENFYRGWGDYKAGFGDPSQEFWIGLDNLHTLTNREQPTKLRVELTAWDGERRVATYDHFTVSSESENYKLIVSGHSGNLSDSLANYHNGNEFSTKDNDNDRDNLNCAQKFKGAWWYKNCHESNLNGVYYTNGLTIFYGRGAVWASWKGQHYSYKTIIMKISA